MFIIKKENLRELKMKDLISELDIKLTFSIAKNYNTDNKFLLNYKANYSYNPAELYMYSSDFNELIKSHYSAFRKHLEKKYRFFSFFKNSSVDLNEKKILKNLKEIDINSDNGFEEYITKYVTYSNNLNFQDYLNKNVYVFDPLELAEKLYIVNKKEDIDSLISPIEEVVIYSKELLYNKFILNNDKEFYCFSYKYLNEHINDVLDVYIDNNENYNLSFYQNILVFKTKEEAINYKKELKIKLESLLNKEIVINS